MTKQVINVGTIPNDGSGDTLRDAMVKVNDNFDELVPITTVITRTVGIGKDFGLLHDALLWAQDKVTSGQGLITLALDAGNHITPIGYLESVSNGYRLNCRLTLKGNTKADTFIVTDKAWTTSARSLFKVEVGSDIDFQDFTINGAKDGGGNYGTAISIDSSGDINLNDVEIRGASTGIYCQKGGKFILLNGVEIVAGNNGISMYYGNGVISGSATINNCINSGIDMFEKGGRVLIQDPALIHSNGIDFSIPINEIQYDGSYISDTTAPLYHKDVPLLITEAVTYTVAADGDPAGVNDFDSFGEAMLWLTTQSIMPIGYLTFLLSDGNHFTSSDNYVYNKVKIKSVSNNASVCFITHSLAGAFGYPTVPYGGVIYFDEITFDPTIDGNSGGYGCKAEGGYIYAQDCVFSNFTSKALSVDNNGTCDLRRCDFSNNSVALDLYDAGRVYIRSSGVYAGNGTAISNASCDVEVTGALTISNSTSVGVSSTNGGICRLGKVSVPTMTGNLSDFNLPVNEIQYNGGYISDGTAALSFKA